MAPVLSVAQRLAGVRLIVIIAVVVYVGTLALALRGGMGGGGAASGARNRQHSPAVLRPARAEGAGRSSGVAGDSLRRKHHGEWTTSSNPLARPLSQTVVQLWNEVMAHPSVAEEDYGRLALYVDVMLDSCAATVRGDRKGIVAHQIGTMSALLRSNYHFDMCAVGVVHAVGAVCKHYDKKRAVKVLAVLPELVPPLFLHMLQHYQDQKACVQPYRRIVKAMGNEGSDVLPCGEVFSAMAQMHNEMRGVWGAADLDSAMRMAFKLYQHHFAGEEGHGIGGVPIEPSGKCLLETVGQFSSTWRRWLCLVIRLINDYEDETDCALLFARKTLPLGEKRVQLARELGMMQLADALEHNHAECALLRAAGRFEGLVNNATKSYLVGDVVLNRLH